MLDSMSSGRASAARSRADEDAAARWRACRGRARRRRSPISDDGHGRLRPPRVGERRQQGGTGGRAGLGAARDRRGTVRRGAARRRRAAAPAWGRARRGPCPSRPRRGRPSTGPPTCGGQPHEAGAHAHHVGDRVERPTSWKETSSGSEPWTRASATARRSKVRSASARTSASRSARCEQARMSRQLRWWTESAISTWQRVAAKPLRLTCSGRSATGSGATASTLALSTSSGTPAPIRAPSSMSPLAPADASIQTLTCVPRRRGRPLACARRHGGRSGRRPRLRRTRCRC